MERSVTATIREMEPSLLRSSNGWIALSPRTAPINIAVIGTTEDGAQARFRESAHAWASLHATPDPDLAD